MKHVKPTWTLVGLRIYLLSLLKITPQQSHWDPHVAAFSVQGSSMHYYHDSAEELDTLCVSRLNHHAANRSSEVTVSTEKISLLGCLFPLWISAVTVNLYRRDTRITEPKCLQRKHKHSWAKVTHSVRDKGAGIFLRKCLINLCFMSVSLSEKTCRSLLLLQ